jgi:serine O-acetyltransferase
LIIGHQGGVVIHFNSRIGDDCVILQNVTLGAASDATFMRGPVLGNRVKVGCGAVIIGGITIGDDVHIGPNTVVTTNIPAGSIVVAPPPRVILLKKKERESAVDCKHDNECVAR